jgi:protein SCO1/2
VRLNRNNIPIGSLALFGLFLLVMLATWLLVKPPAPPAELTGVLRSEYRLLAPFTLTDQHQQRFDEKHLRGKWSMIFFGYLSCPDVCPMTLNELNSFWQLLADKAGSDPEDLQVVFVSVDPARDSPQQLGEYVAHFNRDFIAATGQKTEIDGFAQQFGAGYVIEAETAPGQYLVAHTSAIFLVDPLGRSVATFSQPHYASTLLSQYRKITRYFGATGQFEAGQESGLVARAGLFPLLESPDHIGCDQHQVDHQPNGKESDRSLVPCRRLNDSLDDIARFAFAGLNIAQ